MLVRRVKISTPEGYCEDLLHFTTVNRRDPMKPGNQHLSGLRTEDDGQKMH
jgi:hypothetical protein